ncbi:class I SAM-dependent methyltransferase [Actinospica sp.]|uniref:class I SAM-dependent methyltransferase n=1 Tax=Actinospica sp. TaxID=1872142 RepID=UPI002CA3223F|nr:methyltransferase domain-containing protein [Actinospica sp.]HWG25333.1 methyltransferase domain-containing protein [Actinospica sp.]
MAEKSEFDTETTARHYAAARPTYPSELFDALDELLAHELAGAVVVDVAAGTGIASRQLAERGAQVTAVELSAAMLSELAAASPGVHAVQGSGHALPLADDCADLITYAQAWHWMDPEPALAEARRVLRPHGVLALWWNQTDRSTGWERKQAERITAAVGSDWNRYSATEIAAHVTLPEDLTRHAFTFDWDRVVTLDTHLSNLASKSYIAGLGAQTEPFLANERALLLELFPDQQLTEKFTTLLIAALIGENLTIAAR